MAAAFFFLSESFMNSLSVRETSFSKPLLVTYAPSCCFEYLTTCVVRRASSTKVTDGNDPSHDNPGGCATISNCSQRQRIIRY